MSILGRTGLWRLTRNDAVRGFGRAMRRAGVAAAVMDWYEAPESPGREATEGDGVMAPESVEFATLDDFGDPVPERLRPDYDDRDAVLCAVADGEIVGHCLLSDRPVSVEEIGERVDPPGTYLWRLYVRPADRGRGIGTALLRHARVAVGRDGGSAVHALVAVDNPPSRTAFERAGFEAADRLVAFRLPGVSICRRTTLG